MQARGTLLEVDHPIYGTIVVPRSALRFSDTPQAEYRVSPAYGADNTEVFKGVGVESAELAVLAEEGVV